jgi:hypothetical protein
MAVTDSHTDSIMIISANFPPPLREENGPISEECSYFKLLPVPKYVLSPALPWGSWLPHKSPVWRLMHVWLDYFRWWCNWDCMCIASLAVRFCVSGYIWYLVINSLVHLVYEIMLYSFLHVPIPTFLTSWSTFTKLCMDIMPLKKPSLCSFSFRTISNINMADART